MTKVLIFDWHGVLDTTKFELLLHKLSELAGIAASDVKERISPLERSYAKGETPAEDFWNAVQQELGLTPQQLSEAKDSILRVELNQQLWDMLPRLAQTYALAILSDCPFDKIEIIRKVADLSVFSKVYFSAEKQLFKSDDAFFLDLVQDLGVEVEECVYIDDSPKHIETAQRLGFHACLFSDISDLEFLRQ